MGWTPEQVKDLRQRLGLSQPEFGKRLGYSEKGAAVRVSELESGRRGVSGSVALLLDMLAKTSGEGEEK